MLIDLSGKVAIVTGAGRGIGRDLVLRLASEGVTTAALDIDRSALDALRDELGGPPSMQIVCDVTDAASVADAVGEVVATSGRIDLLVNNAGIIASGPIETLSVDAWRRCFDVNVTGTFLMSQAVVPAMKKQRAGRIINASSFAAIVPTVADSAYASSKAAVAHFSRTLAGELGPWGITVNSYAPGMIPTSLNGFTERPPEEQKRLLDTLTLRRWGSTQDIGDLVCFLASDQASYITGTLIDVSGGKLATQVPGVAYDLAENGDPASSV